MKLNQSNSKFKIKSSQSNLKTFKITDSLKAVQQKPYLFKIVLELKFQTRTIGFIDISTDTLILKRTKNHLLQKNNSLGINAELLKQNIIPFSRIVIQYEDMKLQSTKEYYLAKGEPWNFGDKQIFVPVEELNYKSIIEFERSKQPDLFATAEAK